MLSCLRGFCANNQCILKPFRERGQLWNDPTVSRVVMGRESLSHRREYTTSTTAEQHMIRPATAEQRSQRVFARRTIGRTVLPSESGTTLLTEN